MHVQNPRLFGLKWKMWTFGFWSCLAQWLLPNQSYKPSDKRAFFLGRPGYSGCVLVNSCSWARVSISQFAGHGDRESPSQSRSQPPPALLICFLVFSWDLQSSAGTATVVQIDTMQTFLVKLLTKKLLIFLVLWIHNSKNYLIKLSFLWFSINWLLTINSWARNDKWIMDGLG